MTEQDFYRAADEETVTSADLALMAAAPFRDRHWDEEDKASPEPIRHVSRPVTRAAKVAHLPRRRSTMLTTTNLKASRVTEGVSPSNRPGSSVVRKACLLGGLVLAFAFSNIATASAASVLGSGQKLLAGQSLTSDNGQYRLNMQGDGNLVLYALDSWHRVLWHSHTSGPGHQGAYALMDSAEGHGYFEVVSGGAVLWKTSQEGGSVALLDSGDLQLRSATGVTWSSGTPSSSILAPGQSLKVGQSLTSADRHYRLVMQSDGNLVLERLTDAKPGATTPTPYPAWYTEKPAPGQPVPTKVTMQGDGNLVLYDGSNGAHWNVGISNSSYAGAYLHLQSGDGNLVLWKKDQSVPLWHTSGIPKAISNVYNPVAPSWWRGMCEKDAYPTRGNYEGPTWDGLISCGPGTPDVNELSPLSVDDEFECVELSVRWLYQEFAIPVQYEDGWQVVNNYGSYLQAHPGYPLTKVTPSTASPGSLGPGDVISYGNSAPGHTAVVERTLLDASGTGRIWTLNQNLGGGAGAPSEQMLSVSHWSFSQGSYLATGWLHYTG